MARRSGPINRATPSPRATPAHLTPTPPTPLRDPMTRKGRATRGSIYAGSGDRGYRSAWQGSPYYGNAVTRDSRYSITRSSY